MPDENRPLRPIVSSSSGRTSGASSDQETEQLSLPDRVQPSVSTAAMDGAVLMASLGPRPAGTLQPAMAGADSFTDAEFMLRVKAGDQSAFDYLVQKYRRPLVSFMYRMARNSAAAEDLAQEVFLRVYRSRTTYVADAKFTTWLYRIATNLAVNHARDTRIERTTPTVNLDEPDPESGTTVDVADKTLSVEQRMVRAERMAAIRKHVMDLPERQRMAVYMHKYQELDYREIAGVLKLSESATKSLLFRA